MSAVGQLWVYLSASPLLWLTITLAAYALADRIAVFFKRHPIANPVLIAVSMVVALLWVTGTGCKNPRPVDQPAAADRHHLISAIAEKIAAIEDRNLGVAFVDESPVNVNNPSHVRAFRR